MSDHVFLNLRGLTIILSLFRNEFNKFKNTGKRMLDSIHHMAFKVYVHGFEHFT